MAFEHGWYQTHWFDPRTGLHLPPRHAWLRNQLSTTFGYVAARCIVEGLPSYKLAAMYIEFANVETPGDTVAVPSIDRKDYSYYLTLDGVTRDFLRVPLTQQPKFIVVPGTEDGLPPGAYNQANIGAETVDGVGEHGLAFASEQNSTVYGLAVVATPDFNDPTQDLVYSRLYYAPSQQGLKPANMQLSVTFKLPFTKTTE